MTTKFLYGSLSKTDLKHPGGDTAWPGGGRQLSSNTDLPGNTASASCVSRLHNLQERNHCTSSTLQLSVLPCIIIMSMKAVLHALVAVAVCCRGTVC